MNKINLAEKRELIQNLGKELFDRITNLPEEVRYDDKPRTGIQIVARELGTRNLVMESIYEPSEAARFFAVEKTVRTECYRDITSQDSEDPEFLRFPGNVSYFKHDDRENKFHVAVSGLKAEEDVLIGLIILSRIIKKEVYEIISIFDHCLRGGSLPDQLFDERHYLNSLLKEYK